MYRTVSSIAAFAAAALLLSSCQNVPKYKHSSGKFDEWKSYQGNNFEPVSGAVAAIDTQANTITIIRDKKKTVFPVTSETRIMHQTALIPLSQLPVNTAVRYTVSDDGAKLLTVWYGHLREARHPAQARQQDTFFH